jgi:DNA repair photolyase
MDINGELLQNRMPIHLGGLSDPFSCDEYTDRTIQILSILSSYDYPLIISSKQTEQILRDKVLTELKKLKYLTIQISIPIPNDKLTRLLEPGAPTFSRRLNNMATLHNEGLHVVARIQPILPPLIDEILVNTIPALTQAGCPHVIMECLKIPLEKSGLFNSLFKTLRWDGYEYYLKRGAFIVGRDRVLPPKVAWEQIVGLIERLRDAGMTYGTTDHGLFHLGNTSCCCGVSNREGFSGVFKANYTNIIRSTNSDNLSFTSVTNHWIPQKSIAMYVNSNSRLPGLNCFFSHLRDKWNKPGNVNSPDAYLGVRYTGDRDENGDCLYDKSGIRSYLSQVDNLPIS